jgi:membrane-associated phospholipid phosphatase
MTNQKPQQYDWTRRRLFVLLVQIVGNIIAFLILFQLYKVVRRSFIQRGESVGYDNAHDIIRIEKALHIYIELDLQRWVLQHEWLIKFLNYYYAYFMWSFYACFVIGMIFAPVAYLRIRRVFFLSMLLALPWYAIYPLAPPRFMTAEGFIDTLAKYGPNYFSETGLVAANRFAAMPSMHMGWSTIGAIMLIIALPKWRIGTIIGVAHVAMMCLVVMATGNHWVLDILGGWGIVIASFLVAHFLPVHIPTPWGRWTSQEEVVSGV